LSPFAPRRDSVSAHYRPSLREGPFPVSAAPPRPEAPYRSPRRDHGRETLVRTGNPQLRTYVRPPHRLFEEIDLGGTSDFWNLVPVPPRNTQAIKLVLARLHLLDRAEVALLSFRRYNDATDIHCFSHSVGRLRQGSSGPKRPDHLESHQRAHRRLPRHSTRKDRRPFSSARYQIPAATSRALRFVSSS
jgi:hypothetical protein